MNERLPYDSKDASDEESAVQEGPATRYGRRAVMLGAAAAGVGIVAGLVAGAEPAGAANNGPVLLGETNTAVGTTLINTTSGNGLQATTSENGESGLLGSDLSSGGGYGVLGTSENGTGVQGEAATNGRSGVSGIDTSTGGGHGTYGRSEHGTGAYGENLANGQCGVYGNDLSPSGGKGVQGVTAIGVGVRGEASKHGIAVAGHVGAFNGLAGKFTNPHNSGGRDPFGGTAVRALASVGTYEQLRNDAGGLIVGHGAGEFAGENGIIAAASGETKGGVMPPSIPFGTAGVVGIGPNNEGYGVIGYGRSHDWAGVCGLGTAPSSDGVLGVVTGASGLCAGLYGWNVYDPTGYGVFGTATVGTAIGSVGHAEIVGKLSKSGGAFKIDHPLDPGRKFLYHSCVESPDMMNVYNGTVVLDDHGRATVDLPEFFEALNKDFRYQLTAIGSPAPELHVASEVADNTFAIAGGSSGQKVSWQVTGVRQDRWAEANRVLVEVDKPEEDQGRYLHPDLFEDGHGRALTAIAKMRDRAQRYREATQT